MGVHRRRSVRGVNLSRGGSNFPIFAVSRSEERAQVRRSATFRAATCSLVPAESRSRGWELISHAGGRVSAAGIALVGWPDSAAVIMFLVGFTHVDYDMS